MSHASPLIETDIQAYLASHERKDLLRFITCGSVDDGKSTLIGRLLYDTQLIYEDQLAAVRRDTTKYGTTGEELDLALLVDGLQAEREQGITIDVAYRYFSTEKRKFIIADTPGHEQYTRNMATGASTAQLAILVVDARKGVQAQTCRHSFIVSLLGIRHLVLAVNKMDLVGFDSSGIRADSRGVSGIRGPVGGGGSPLHPGVGAARRQRGATVRRHALVRRSNPVAMAGTGGGRRRPQPARFPLSGAIRQSAPPRFSRLLRHHRRRGGSTGRRGGGAALGPAQPDRGRWSPPAASWPRPRPVRR